ncbi:MAG: hypothetical protein ABIH23_18720, partial [bacterium]
GDWTKTLKCGIDRVDGGIMADYCCGNGAFLKIALAICLVYFCVSLDARAESDTVNTPVSDQGSAPAELIRSPEALADAFLVLKRLSECREGIRKSTITDLHRSVNPANATACLFILAATEFPEDLLNESYRQGHWDPVLRTYHRYFEEIFEPVSNDTTLAVCRLLAKVPGDRQFLIAGMVRQIMERTPKEDRLALCDKLPDFLPLSYDSANAGILITIRREVSESEAIRLLDYMKDSESASPELVRQLERRREYWLNKPEKTEQKAVRRVIIQE